MCNDTDTPDVLDDRRRADVERLESENERLKAHNAALADALRQMLRESADGVFAPGPAAIRAAKEALAMGEVTP